jgi:pimeloyl-ACP methyl ester carboxylesterase
MRVAQYTLSSKHGGLQHMSNRLRVTVESGLEVSARIEGEGPVDVLFVHGWMTSGAVWDSALARLDRAGRRFIVPDQRGSGESDKPDSGYAIERYARDLVALLDAVSSCEVIVVGHSMGGQLSLALAALAPDRVRALALLCPVPPSGMALPPEAAGLFRTSAGDRDKQRTILSLACTSLAEQERERMLDAAATVCAPCIEQAFDAWTGGAIEAQAASVRAPTLVLATDDPFLPPAFLQDAVVSKLSRARLAVLPGAGHYPQCERPAETAAIIEAFVTGASAR